MKWSRVILAWAVITMMVTIGTIAQQPTQVSPSPSQVAPNPLFLPAPWINDIGGRAMRMGSISCRMVEPRNNAFVCRCYVSREEATCMILLRTIAMRMDSMREGRMDRPLSGRLPDNMRIHRDSMRRMIPDSVRRRMVDSIEAHRPGRRP